MTHRKLWRDQRGISTAVALLSLTIMMVVAFATGTIGIQNLASVTANRNSAAAQYAAEAGAAMAIGELNKNSAWNAGFANQALPTAPGSYTVTIVNNLSNPLPVAGFGGKQVPGYAAAILSRGRVGQSQRQVEVVVGQSSAFNKWAVFGDEKVKLKGELEVDEAADEEDALEPTDDPDKEKKHEDLDKEDKLAPVVVTDSYDSRKGTFAATHAFSDGTVGTNSTKDKAIKITKDAQVYGEVDVGAGGDPTKGIQVKDSAAICGPPPGGTPTTPCAPGTTKSLSTPQPLPLPELPPGRAVGKTTIKAEKGESILLPPGDFKELKIGDGHKGGTVTLTAGTYVFSKVDVHEGGTLVIDSSKGPVKIFVDGPFKVKNEGTKEHDPKDIHPESEGKGIVHVADGQPSEKAANFMILGLKNAKKIEIKGEEKDTGESIKVAVAVYAPGAKVKIKRHTDILGSLIGKKVEVKKASTVHRDLGLGDVLGIPGPIKTLSQAIP